MRYTLLHMSIGVGGAQEREGGVADEGGRGAWVGVGVVGTGWEEG